MKGIHLQNELVSGSSVLCQAIFPDQAVVRMGTERDSPRQKQARTAFPAKAKGEQPCPKTQEGGGQPFPPVPLKTPKAGIITSPERFLPFSMTLWPLLRGF